MRGGMTFCTGFSPGDSTRRDSLDDRPHESQNPEGDKGNPGANVDRTERTPLVPDEARLVAAPTCSVPSRPAQEQPHEPGNDDEPTDQERGDPLAYRWVVLAED